MVRPPTCLLGHDRVVSPVGHQRDRNGSPPRVSDPAFGATRADLSRSAFWDIARAVRAVRRLRGAGRSPAALPAMHAERRLGMRAVPQMVLERFDVGEIVRSRVLADMAYPAELGVE